ncbi:MAG: STAS/SEC14 domain-containing protein [Pseudomonadota bacterium]
MFTVHSAGDDRLDISVSGEIDDVEAAHMIDALLVQAKGIENGRMLIDVDDFQLPTLGAFTVELSMLPELFRFSRQFTHAAVLADEPWVRRLSSIEGRLIPGMVIKSFRKDQRYQAESWLGSMGQR